VVRRRLRDETGPSGGPALTDVLGVMVEWTPSSTTLRTEDGVLVHVQRADIVSGKPVPPRPSVRHRATPGEAEVRAGDSWPPLVTEPLGGWRLRAAGGFTARANSVLAVGDPGRRWDEALAEVRRFYAGHRLPVRAEVVVGSPEQLRLEAEGWLPLRPVEADSVFQMTGVARALRRRPPPVPPLVPAPVPVPVPVPVRLTDHVTEGWLANDSRALSHRDVAVAVLEGPPVVTFASAEAGGRTLAKGRAALSERADVWLGITDIWVDPAQRRRGLASAVLTSLLQWGAERGATTAYLQLRGDNAAALAAYARLGFRTHHCYRYLAAPP